MCRCVCLGGCVCVCACVRRISLDVAWITEVDAAAEQARVVLCCVVLSYPPTGPYHGDTRETGNT